MYKKYNTKLKLNSKVEFLFIWTKNESIITLNWTKCSDKIGPSFVYNVKI